MHRALLNSTYRFIGSEQTVDWFQNAVRDTTAAIVVSLVAIAFYVSCASMLFTGSLVMSIHTGIGIALAGGAIHALVAAWKTSISRASVGPEPATVPVVAGITAVIATQTSPSAVLPTAVAAIAISALMVGLSWFVIGKFRAGDVIRYVPYPVIGGFLAGVGWLMLSGGLAVIVGSPVSWAWVTAAFSERPTALTWAGIVMTAALWFGTQRSKHMLTLPVLILVSSLGAHLWLHLSGVDIDTARRTGWLMASFDQAMPEFIFRPELLQAIDWQVLLSQWKEFIAVVLVSTVGLLLADGSLEIAFNEEADFNRDLKTLGLGNILLGLAGGLVSGISISRSVLNVQAGARGRLSGGVKGVICLIAMFAGGPIIALIPKPLLAALLMNIGIGMLKTWLVDAKYRLANGDYPVIVSMTAITIISGYLPAVFLGVVFCCFDFAFLAAQQSVIHRVATGGSWAVRAEHGFEERQAIEAHGHELLVLELQGVLFFGSVRQLSHRIESMVGTAGRVPRQILIDFARVPAIDSSAANALARTMKMLSSTGTQVCLSSANRKVEKTLIATGCVGSEGADLMPDLDQAVERWEESVLALHASEVVGDVVDNWLKIKFSDPAVAERVVRCLETVRLDTGEALFRRGDQPDAVYWLESGRLTAKSELRSVSIKSGSTVGETSVFSRMGRRADVIAERPSVLRRLTRTHLEAIERDFGILTASTVATSIGDNT
jgi:sulfate permease, SulP family